MSLLTDPRAALAGAALVTSLALAIPTTGFAQPRTYEGSTCRSISPEPCEPGIDDCGETASCLTFSGVDSICIPDAPICCTLSEDCPIAPFETQCRSFGTTGARACLESADYCEEGAELTLERIRACHTFAMAFVPFDQGDCDGDGLPNKFEIDEGLDHCAGPTIGVWDGEACTKPEICFERDSICTAAETGTMSPCVELGDHSAYVCMAEDAVPCGDNRLTCPRNLVEWMDPTSDRVWCIDTECQDAPVDLLDCVTDPGGTPVRYEDGNCDGDEYPNGTDPDPCSSENVVPMPDGSPDGIDGGAPSATGVQFVGGGGCMCRVTPGPSPRPWLGALLLLGLALSARGARRARRSR